LDIMLPELSVQILVIAKEHGRVTVAEATRQTNSSRNTIKDHLKTLVSQGHLVKYGAGRGTWYAVA
jgi:predicted HTH transcriptional regulator